MPEQGWQEAEAQASRAALGRELQRGNLREALRLADALWAAGTALGPQQSDVLLHGRHPPCLLPWVCHVALFHWTVGRFMVSVRATSKVLACKPTYSTVLPRAYHLLLFQLLVTWIKKRKRVLWRS